MHMAKTLRSCGLLATNVSKAVVVPRAFSELQRVSEAEAAGGCCCT